MAPRALLLEASQQAGLSSEKGPRANRHEQEVSWPGYHFHSAAQPGTHLWQMRLDLATHPELDGHRVKGKAILPAAAYLQIALAAAREIAGDKPHTLEQVSFKEALIVPESEGLTTQMTLSPERPGMLAFKFYSLDEKNGNPRLHATGSLRISQEEEIDFFMADDLISQSKARCLEHREGSHHYAAMQSRGLHYGGEFQRVKELWRRDGEALARVSFSEETDEFGVMSVPLLDACFQALESALPESNGGDGGNDCYVPVGLESFRVYRQPSCQPGRELWSRASLRQTEQDGRDQLEGDVLVLNEEGQPVLEVTGLRVKRVESSDAQGTKDLLGDWFYQVQWQPLEEVQPVETRATGEANTPGIWLILADEDGLGEALADQLEAQGEVCQMVFPEKAGRVTSLEPGQLHRDRPNFAWIDPADAGAMWQVVEEAATSHNLALKGIVHLWNTSLQESSLSAEDANTLFPRSQLYGCESVMYLIQALTIVRLNRPPRLWLVSRGAQPVLEGTETTSPVQAMLWGLGRGIMLEHQEFKCTLVDLSPEAESDESLQLLREIMNGRHEDQIALRNGRCYAARMTSQSVEELEAALPQGDGKKTVAIAAGQQFHLKTLAPGSFEHLVLQADHRQTPQESEIEIEVLAAGLNFIDVMKAMGVYPGQAAGELSLGIECAGRIVALGKGVTGFQVSDEVMAVVPSVNAFSAYATVPASLAALKPRGMSFAEAATTPIAYLTAYFALHHQGRLARGERVLIHAAAGGVGLAAVRICQHFGAEIYATAGSPEKRDFLRTLGIEHIFDSRSLAFATEIMRQTKGEGLDIVLNSLAGEAIPASLELLREGGRFLEIGKQDIYQNAQLGLLPFRRNISFSAIHLDAVLRQRPNLLGELSPFFEAGSFTSLPVQVFPVSETASAFRYMAQAKHIGKIALSMAQPDIQVIPLNEKKREAIRADATYLITGGMGGIGLSTANWLVERGARHLVLMGRTGATGESASAIERMRRKGAEVVVAKADVSQAEQLARVLKDLEETMPPLKGVFHAAGLLDDGVLQHMTRDRFYSVMAPKVAGAWNLHTQTIQTELDFFVLFSSVASLIGSPGQTNYSAGNAFLDGLAHYRGQHSLPALSINWGTWTEVGMAAQPDRGGRLALRGLDGLAPEQGIAALAFLLEQDAVQMAVMPFDCAQWAGFYPAAATSSLYANLIRGKSQPVQDELRPTELDPVKAILAAPTSEQESLIQTWLSQQITKVLGLTNAKTARLNAHQPLNRLGMDSLMALEIKNLIEKGLKVAIPIVRLLGGSSLAEIAALALAQLKDQILAAPESFGVNEYTDLAVNQAREKSELPASEIETAFLGEFPELGQQEWEEVEI